MTFARSTGTQDFVGAAPLNLVYVAHGERMTDVGPEERRLFASADACFIGQNVYLFCASEGLATVFRGSANQARLGAALELAGRPVRDFRADGRLSARLSAHHLGATMQDGERAKPEAPASSRSTCPNRSSRVAGRSRRRSA